jgi:hypothetical protein
VALSFSLLRFGLMGFFLMLVLFEVLLIWTMFCLVTVGSDIWISFFFYGKCYKF